MLFRPRFQGGEPALAQTTVEHGEGAVDEVVGRQRLVEESDGYSCTERSKDFSLTIPRFSRIASASSPAS